MPRATELLRTDHRKVQKLFQQFEEADGRAEQKRIADTVIRELRIHSKLEEEIFYPAVRRHAQEGGEIVGEATVEHHVADMLIDELSGMSASSPELEPTFKVLAESVRHHIKEEEGRMLPQAEKSGIDLEDIGERMTERKEELMAEEPEPATRRATGDTSRRAAGDGARRASGDGARRPATTRASGRKTSRRPSGGRARTTSGGRSRGTRAR